MFIPPPPPGDPALHHQLPATLHLGEDWQLYTCERTGHFIPEQGQMMYGMHGGQLAKYAVNGPPRSTKIQNFGN